LNVAANQEPQQQIQMEQPQAARKMTKAEQMKLRMSQENNVEIHQQPATDAGPIQMENVRQ